MRPPSSQLIAITAAAEVLLVVATAPLWLMTSEFPTVPLFSILQYAPVFLHQVLATLFIVACMGLVRRHWKSTKTAAKSSDSTEATKECSRSRRLTFFVLILGGALAVLDLHRLQPWHWLFLLLLAQELLFERRDFHRTAQLTFATIYIFAAASRLGPDVDSGMSGQVLRLILNSIGLESVRSDSETFFIFAAVINGIELLAGILLLIPQFRRLGVGMIVVLHVILLLCLGPLGLNHHPGVLIWNTFLLVAIPLMFWLASSDPHPPGRLCRLVQAALIAFPLSGLFGIADNWLSWQVYSPRPEKLTLFVDEESVRHLPNSLQQLVQDPLPLQTVCVVRLDLWSLKCQNVPLYPEDRFQMTVARKVVLASVANGADFSDFQATMESPNPLRWWLSSESVVSIRDDSAGLTPP